MKRSMRDVFAAGNVYAELDPAINKTKIYG